MSVSCCNETQFRSNNGIFKIISETLPLLTINTKCIVIIYSLPYESSYGSVLNSDSKAIIATKVKINKSLCDTDVLPSVWSHSPAVWGTRFFFAWGGKTHQLSTGFSANIPAFNPESKVIKAMRIKSQPALPWWLKFCGIHGCLNLETSVETGRTGSVLTVLINNVGIGKVLTFFFLSLKNVVFFLSFSSACY